MRGAGEHGALRVDQACNAIRRMVEAARELRHFIPPFDLHADGESPSTKGLDLRLQPFESSRDTPHNWLRGPSLLTALENLPLHTWSATVQGEMLRLLHGLAWLYNHEAHGTLADTALALALRLATTPEQLAYLWLYRGWLTATASPVSQSNPEGVPCAGGALLLELQRARAHCVNAPLARALQGVEALLQGDEALALTCFAQVLIVPEVPAVQALSVAAWFWAHARQGTLEQALGRARKAPPLWQTDDTLVAALEMLLAWTSGEEASAPLGNSATRTAVLVLEGSVRLRFPACSALLACWHRPISCRRAAVARSDT